MSLIIKTITGRTLTGNAVKDDFNIIIDDQGYIIAELISGGITRITYDFFDPGFEDGDLIYKNFTPDGNFDVLFQRYYPFAYYQNAPNPPLPTLGINILVIVFNQTVIGVNDGIAEVSATGDGAPYEYSLDNINWNTENIFKLLAPGDYKVNVRSISDNDLINYSNFTIGAAPLPPDPTPQPPIKDCVPIEDADILINDAYKRVRVKTIFGKAPSLLSNGDFEVYDGQNWQFWAKYGGINVSRIQRTVINSNGESIPIDNYALQFNEKAVDTKYIEHSPIAVNFGDTVKLGYRVGRTPGTGNVKGIYKVGLLNIPATYETVYISKVRIKCGEFFLYNPDYGTTYQWVLQVATVGHKVDNPQGDLSTYSISIGIPACPVSGNLTVQFFGFVKTQIITPATVNGSNGNSITFPPVITEINEYDIVSIDDVTAVKTSQDAENDIDSMLSISDNLRFFSQTPETIDILFGDFFYRNKYIDELDNLYAIKYGDEYTKGWAEYGAGTSAYIPFGMGLAKSILTSYQMPFKKWYGSFKGDGKEFGYLDVFGFIVEATTFYEDRFFQLLGMEINIKDNTANNVVLAESFRRPAKSNDTTIPSYPNMPEPIFVQDPNAINNIGIFTEEFTEEFS